MDRLRGKARGQQGTTLMEVVTTLGLIGVLVMLASTLFSNIEVFTSKNSATISARNESLVLLTMIRKAYSVDLLDPRGDATIKKVSAEDSVESTFIASDGKLTTIVSGIGSKVTMRNLSGGSETLFSFHNRCRDLPAKLRDKMPTLNFDYFNRLLIDTDLSKLRNKVDFDMGSCHRYLGNFQCGLGQTSYIEFTLGDGRKNFYVPAAASPRRRWRSLKYSPIAAFICHSSNKSAGYYDRFIDIAVWTAIPKFHRWKKSLSGAERQQLRPGMRLQWQVQRMIMTPASPSQNALYIKK